MVDGRALGGLASGCCWSAGPVGGDELEAEGYQVHIHLSLTFSDSRDLHIVLTAASFLPPKHHIRSFLVQLQPEALERKVFWEM